MIDFSGEVQTFSGSQGRWKTISGEMRTSPHLPSKSGHALFLYGQCLPMWCKCTTILFCFVFHSKQITLNETRDTLRETYKMVSDTLELLFSVPRPIFYNENYVWNCALRYRIQIPVLYSAMDSCGEWDTHYLKKNIQQNFNVSRESPSFEYLEWQFHYWLFFDIYFEYGACFNR